MNRQTSTHILMLEQFGDAKEQSSRFHRTNRFSHIQEIDNLGEEDSTLPWTDGGFIEHSGFLDDRLIC